MKEQKLSIEGKWIKDYVAECGCQDHPGVMDRYLLKKHHCLGKRCKHLEMLVDVRQKRTIKKCHKR